MRRLFRGFCLGSGIGLCLALALTAACAGDDARESADYTAAATTNQLESMCVASCALFARCSPQASSTSDAGADCIPHCVSRLGDLASDLRRDIVVGLTRCYAGLACGVLDDGCTAVAVAGTGESVDAALHAPDVQTCLDKEKECQGTSGSFSDDECGLLPLLVTRGRTALGRCFTLDCGSVPSCLAGLYGAGK